MGKKIIETKLCDKYEILTDDGFQDILALHKTIPYQVYKLSLDDYELKCADNHIVFLEDYTEIFVKDLIVGQKIITKDGVQEVISVENCGYEENMYDIELKDENHEKYYTNDILSHNTYYVRRLVRDLVKRRKKILYLPNNMTDSLGTPTFNNFLLGWVDDNMTEEDRRGIIIIIEDAERVLLKRDNNPYGADGVSMILNSSDGIMNDLLNIQLIVTFNTDIANIDEAILRKKRAISIREFTALDVADSQRLIDHLGIQHVASDPMCVADIYSLKQEEEDNLLVGKKKNKGSIGFKK